MRRILPTRRWSQQPLALGFSIVSFSSAWLWLSFLVMLKRNHYGNRTIHCFRNDTPGR